MWRVFLNGKSIGIIETNFTWADPYWRSRCTSKKRYRLVEGPAKPYWQK
jgi:hypothetical protein